MSRYVVRTQAELEEAVFMADLAKDKNPSFYLNDRGPFDIEPVLNHPWHTVLVSGQYPDSQIIQG